MVIMASSGDSKCLRQCAECAVFAAPDDVFHKCGACHSAMYCGAACQRKHWPMHKIACKADAAMAQAAAVASAGFKRTLAAALGGDVSAQVQAGNSLLSGVGVAADAVEAVAWFRKAAEAGRRDAQHQLGVCFRDGTGVPVDHVQSAAWLRMAVAGDAAGQFQLNCCYCSAPPFHHDAIRAKVASANALIAEAAALGGAFKVAPYHDLSWAQAAQLQTWVGGSASPRAWAEVYRGTRDGFSPMDFHSRCDNRQRLLILVRDAEAGCLFGGFTEIGMFPELGNGVWRHDPSSFLFSLTNPADRPERLAPRVDGFGVCCNWYFLACMGNDLYIADGCASNKNSYTHPGRGYAASSAAGGPHPMSQGKVHFTVAELVAWTVPQ